MNNIQFWTNSAFTRNRKKEITVKFTIAESTPHIESHNIVPEECSQVKIMEDNCDWSAQSRRFRQICSKRKHKQSGKQCRGKVHNAAAWLGSEVAKYNFLKENY